MPHYRFKLTPVDTFFFGTEKHDVEGRANYFVTSYPYPQQTTLLGLIRYFLLDRAGMIGTDKIRSKGAALIGESSFDYHHKDPPQIFGKIAGISPLYFMKGDTRYDIAPRDISFNIVTDSHANYSLQHVDTLEQPARPYVAKDNTPHLQLINATGERITLEGAAIDTAVIYEQTQVGIEKLHNGDQDDTKKYYKQTLRRMTDDWCFAIDAEIGSEPKLEPIEGIYYMPFGGERSTFKIEVTSINEPNITPRPYSMLGYSRSLWGIFCQSDCFVGNEIFDGTLFSINDALSFRNMKSKVSTLNYANLIKKEEDKDIGLERSDRQQLLARGSVLYYDSQASRNNAKTLLDNANGRTIGFNHYHLIN
jgi:CRISPR-associated protein Cmr3